MFVEAHMGQTATQLGYCFSELSSFCHLCQTESQAVLATVYRQVIQFYCEQLT